MVDYLNDLRESCLEAYTGIVQGLKGDGESPCGKSAVYLTHNSLFPRKPFLFNPTPFVCERVNVLAPEMLLHCYKAVCVCTVQHCKSPVVSSHRGCEPDPATHWTPVSVYRAHRVGWRPEWHRYSCLLWSHRVSISRGPNVDRVVVVLSPLRLCGKTDTPHTHIHTLLFRDLCTAFGVAVLPHVEKENINNLLTKGRRSKTQKTKTLATWATREIRKLKNASSSTW